MKPHTNKYPKLELKWLVTKGTRNCDKRNNRKYSCLSHEFLREFGLDCAKLDMLHRIARVYRACFRN